MNRIIPKAVLAAAFLQLVQAAVLAQSKIEVTSRLLDYDLAQVVGQSSTDTSLPRLVVTSGSQGTVELTGEYKYPTGGKKLFFLTAKGTVILGLRCPIYVRDNNNGTFSFLLRAEISERVDQGEGAFTVIKTTTSYWGERPFDKQFTIQLKAPQGRSARLELTMTHR